MHLSVCGNSNATSEKRKCEGNEAMYALHQGRVLYATHAPLWTVMEQRYSTNKKMHTVCYPDLKALDKRTFYAQVIVHPNASASFNIFRCVSRRRQAGGSHIPGLKTAAK